MKTKIKPIALRTYIKEVKDTLTNTVRLDQIPKDFDFSKVTDLQIASVAEIKAKMTAINGTILINSAANLENQEAVGENDYWGQFGTPERHDFGFDYYTTPTLNGPQSICNKADMSNELGQVYTIYQDNNPEAAQLPEEQFLAKVKDVMMIALSEDGTLRLIGNTGDDCNDLVTLVTEEEIHTKGIYFRGADGQEHKLNQDLPELAELEEMFSEDETTADEPESNVVIYNATYTDNEITGIQDNPALIEIKTHFLAGKNVLLQEDGYYYKLTSLEPNAAVFIQPYVADKGAVLHVLAYDSNGTITKNQINS